MQNKIEIEKIYSLSPMQEGMLFHSLVDEASNAYFEQLVLTIRGKIDYSLFEKGLNILTERYDILRTIFQYENVTQPLQIVLKRRKFKIDFKDLSHLREEEKQEELEELKQQDKTRGFDLTRSHLMRILLLKTGEDGFKLIWSYHHILMDGWCLGIIFREFAQIYSSLFEGKPLELKLVTQYRHYIKWLKEQDIQVGLNFWQEYLKGYDQPALLPGRKQPVESAESAENRKYELKSVEFTIEGELEAGLLEIAKKHQVTLSTICQTVWGLVLQVYNNMDDVVFGAVVSGRPAGIDGIETMIGLFINTIPVRIIRQEGQTFCQLLKSVHQNAIRLKSFEYLPLAEIQANSFLKRDLINHILVFENFPRKFEVSDTNDRWQPQFIVDDMEIFEQTNYNFNIIFVPSKNFVVKFYYNDLVYEEMVIKNIGLHLREVMKQVVDNPGIPIKAIEIITKEEKQQIIFDFNDTAADYPGDKTIHQLFEEQVERTPNYIALVGVHQSHQFSEKGTKGFAPLSTHMHLTYNQLNKISNQLVDLLREKGIQPDTVVGIMMERSVEMIVGILGILKAGGAYLPIDLGYPLDRINYMLSDSRAKFLVTTTDLVGKYEKLSIVNCQLSIVNEAPPKRRRLNNLPKEANSINNSQLNSSNLAYIIYTSGSTGRPKGVLVEHHNAVNVVCWFGRSYLAQPHSHVAMMSDYTFDPSVNQVFGTLLHRGVLYILKKELLLNLEKLRQYIEMHQVQVVNFVPAAFNELLGKGKKLESIKVVLSGGERLDEVVKNNIIQEGYVLYNQYGPTETTIDALVEKCSKQKVTLGKPISNVSCYIFDKYNHLVPLKVAGELYIGGAGVARGYLNNQELTAEKFCLRRPGGTLSPHHSPHYSIYRTGDLTRWLEDGNIEFLGRIDHQVKIKGYRIELGEIENRLLNHDDIKEAVVMAVENEDRDNILTAWVQAEKKLELTSLRQYLAEQLPDYMIPSHFFHVKAIPLNPNGKIDKKKLLEQRGDAFQSSTTYVEPKSGQEIIIANIWKEVLQVDKVGLNDNFFDLGGHSIAIIMVNVRLKKAFNRDIPIVKMFRYPTVGSLSTYLSQQESTEADQFSRRGQDIHRAIDKSKAKRKDRIQKRKN